MRQRRALLQLQMVLALTLTLVLVLTLALAPSGMISKKGVPEFCPSTVVEEVAVEKKTIFLEVSASLGTPRMRKKRAFFWRSRPSSELPELVKSIRKSIKKSIENPLKNQ